MNEPAESIHGPGSPGTGGGVATEDVARHTSISLSKFTNWILGGYLALVLALMLAFGVKPSIDIIAVFLAIAAVLVGRGKAFARDWAPFVLVFLAWESMRGVANAFGQSVQGETFVALSRSLFFGHVPAADLQAWLYVPGHITALDIGLTVVYASHFFFPIALAFWYWLKDRPTFYRFTITLMLVSYGAFLTFLIMPVAPPRFAANFGADLHVVDITAQVAAQVRFGFDWLYVHAVGNPYAAFPSMHAAYPLLVFLFLRERRRLAAWLWAPFMLTVWFAVVYLGHHYVIDVVGGIAYGLAGYYLARSPRAGRVASRLATAWSHAIEGILRGLKLRTSLHD